MCWKCEGTTVPPEIIHAYDQAVESAKSNFALIVKSYQFNRSVGGLDDVENLAGLSTILAKMEKDQISSILIGAVVQAAGGKHDELKGL